jgi:hypothetical protein
VNGRTKGVPRSMGPCLRRGMLPVQFIIIIIACCYYYLLLLLCFIIMDLLLLLLVVCPLVPLLVLVKYAVV